MKSKIGKDFYWEMSHRLKDHAGLCRNIHGHSYRMRIEVVGEIDSSGMIMDYYDIAQVVNPIIKELDHAFLCDEDDQLMIGFLKENNFKYKIMKEPSTAENICSFILSEIYDIFKERKNLTTLIVRIYETEDVFAEKRKKIK
jgi:6-pyruvoyltetrahydropterin/6-carboxytetrahydropterin synthase